MVAPFYSVNAAFNTEMLLKKTIQTKRRSLIQFFTCFCINNNMKTFYCCFFLMLAYFYSNPLQGQDLSGVWVGNYSKHIMMTTPEKLVVELFLHNDSLITGASHLYYSNNMYEHYTLVGSYNRKDSIAHFREDSTLGVKLGFLGSNCLGNYTTRLTITDTSMLLTGKWSDNATSIIRCPTVKVHLGKPLPQKKIPVAAKAKKPETAKVIVKDKTEDKNLERASEIQSLIEIPIAEKDSIKIELYDNKEIDGDIISLYLNEEVLLHKQMLTASPLVLYVSLSNGTLVDKIKMAAESMGSDPPCTAMMLITTRTGKKYQVNLSSNYNKNGIVEFFLKQESLK
jgi:hypothetical protein